MTDKELAERFRMALEAIRATQPTMCDACVISTRALEYDKVAITFGASNE